MGNNHSPTVMKIQKQRNRTNANKRKGRSKWKIRQGISIAQCAEIG